MAIADSIVIETTSLGRSFGDIVAVSGISLSVGEGEVFGFLGPNGAGKTTTVRMLTCLLSPSTGSAQVCGHDITRESEATEVRRKVGILTENAGFYDTMTARRNLRFYADLYHIDRRESDRRINEYLDRFGLGDVGDRVVGGFSRGMRQKLAIIRSMIHEPEVLFLDEPTSGLDPESAWTVRDFILKLKSDGKTIFLCTHNLNEAERLCDKVAIIDKKITYTGTPRKLKDIAYGRKLVVWLEEFDQQLYETISRLASVNGIEKVVDRLILQVDDPEKHGPDIVNAIVKAGGRIRSVGELGHSMEDVYRKLMSERYDL